MAEMILPGVYIDVRSEGLIVPGRVTVGNLGVVGTASKGDLNKPILLGSYAEAQQIFGQYDAFYTEPETPTHAGTKKENSLTLVRALELAFSFGATNVFAVRVSGIKKVNDKDVKATGATHKMDSATTKEVLTLTAKNEGTWGNDLMINVTNTDQDDNDIFIKDEAVTPSGGNFQLSHSPVVEVPRNRVSIHGADGFTRTPTIVYTGEPKEGEVKIDTANGKLEFPATPALAAGDKVSVAYTVNKSSAVKVTLKLGKAVEVYTVLDGKSLIDDVNKSSLWVNAKGDKADKLDEPLDKSPSANDFLPFTGGDNGEANADYRTGLDKLLDQDAHIIVAAGQGEDFGNELDKHCQKASTDVYKRDRVGVVGSKLGDTTNPSELFDRVRAHNLASDRVIFVTPGIKSFDSAADPPAVVTLPGAYAAAAVAGLMSSYSPHISLTNKVLPVDGLERRFTPAELTQLVQSRVLALEQRQGFRIVKGITTSTNTAFAQITTRRIVDFAKFGVRSAASPYIGLLNNDRVRSAMRATINSFLAEMVEDEMLVSYELDVTATREEERKGIARVTLVLRPTFSIDFIKVTMVLD